MLEELIAELENLTQIKITENLMASIGDLMKPVQYAKGEYIVEQGVSTRQFLYITQGLIRVYFNTSDGNEVSKVFLKEGDFVAPYADILLKIPSTVSIHCLENCQALAANFDTLCDHYGEHIFWDRIGRVIAEKEYIRKEKKERLLLKNPEDRYKNFLQDNDQVVKRVPQQYIASYLGMTPVSLSRIKKRILSEK